MTTHGLELGSLDLASGLVHEDGYTLSVLGEGATFGASEAAVREIVSMLADGNLVSYDRAGNRVASFDVLVEGADGVALQAGEVALRRELYRPNTVTWTPPAGFSAPTVFEVVTSEMTPSFDDVDELRGRRKFRVSLTCAPFARSATQTTVAALAPPPVTPVTAVLTNADTTAGWTATLAANINQTVTAVTPTDQGAYVQATATDRAPRLTLTWTTSAVSMATTKYLTVEYSGTSVPDFAATIDGVQRLLTPTSSRTTVDGTVLYAFDTGGGSLTSVSVGAGSTSLAVTTVTINVHDISRTNTLPQVSSHQLTRTIEVGGTERTPASIHVESTTNLGITVVHTSPEDGSGYSPPLRRWRVGGGSPVSGGPFSGLRESVGPTSFHAKVPTSSLPEGGYQMIAIMRNSTTATVTVPWDIWTIPPGATTDADRQGNVTGKVAVPFTANVWAMVVLAEDISLPTLRTRAGQVEVFIGGPTGLELDEAWLFRTDDDCALSYVNVNHKNLWLDSANQDSPVPTVWVGDTADGRAHPGNLLAGMGAHVLHPDGTTVFAATSIAENPAVSAQFYRRYHSNAAD